MVPTKNIKIFLIEQNPEMNGILLSILHELQFNDIHLYKSVEVAWNGLKQTKPDLIICDWYPDKKDALGLLKKVRSRGKESYIPFIIVSGIVEHELVELAVAMGVDEYVVKPFNIKILEDKINAAILGAHHQVEKHQPKKIEELDSFKTKLAVCIENPTLAEQVTQCTSQFETQFFNHIEEALIAAHKDVYIDVIIVEDTILRSSKRCRMSLINMMSSGQLEVIVVKSEENDVSNLKELKNEGFRHFVFPEIYMGELLNKIELLVSLKKALLHTKDTVSLITLGKLKDKELRDSLLESIQKETSAVAEKSNQLISTSKKSSFAHKLGKDIALSAQYIDSITNVISSISKDKKELEHSPKEKVSIKEILNSAEHLFENILTERKIKFERKADCIAFVHVNPTHFTSLFMFLLKGIIIDARYESDITFGLKVEPSSQFVTIEITAIMGGYPHLNNIVERIWFEKGGKMKFSLKPSINQLSKSQLHNIDIDFEQDKEELKLTLQLAQSMKI